MRITEEPFVPYLEWEIACLYSIFLQTETEIIHLVPKDRLGDIKLPAGDFWIFDEKIVLEWTFKGSKNETAGAVIFDNQVEVERYLVLRDTLIKITESVSS